LELLNSLIEYDKQLLLYLHSKGSLTWDSFWIFITNPLHWIWLFFVIYFFGFKIFGFKKTTVISLFIAISGISSLMFVNLIKNSVQRLRPINDITINESLRVLIEQNDFSFVSGHSTVSFTIAFLSFWILKKYYKYAYILFLFPILFAYSRIYLAVHFPFDIIVGMGLGFVIALIFYRLTHFFVFKE